MPYYQIYFIIALLLLGSEIIVPGFVLAPLGIATLLSATAAYFTDYLLVHTLVFCISSGVIFYLLSKFNFFNRVKPASDQTTGLVGQVGRLTEISISPLTPGKMRIFADDWEIFWEDTEEWQRKIFSMKIGGRLRVVKVIGNKVCVEPLLNTETP